LFRIICLAILEIVEKGGILGDITKNFSFYEFKPKNEPKSWKPNSYYQKMLITTLAKNLQIIRNKLPSGSYMKVTSGVRLLSDYERLKAAGYRPSKTSDHNCGVAIKLKPDTFKFKKFGETYNFSVGAADIVSVGMSVWDLFKLSFRLTKESMCDFGQIIYEKIPGTEIEWIHYGNSLKHFFSSHIIKMISRQKFLKSLDGGKTYEIIDNINKRI